MAKKQNEQDRVSQLLASVSEDMLGDGLPQHLRDNSIKVERILLELVRPDPIQPRRVLPEELHHSFHGNRLTPTQALRELVQIAQVAARQRGRPFSNVLELLPDPERDTDEVDMKLTSEEKLLSDLVNLAVTIRDDGQVNPITVIDVSQGVSQLFRIETGERRYWASWILRDFVQGEHDGMVDCIVVPGDRSSIFRQAKENTARSGLSAIAMARQAALLLLTANDFEIPNHAVGNDFYRQALELRIPRGMGQEIYAAMGGIGKMRFSQFKSLLSLSDEAMEIADRNTLDEAILRHVISLHYEDQAEMLHQVVNLDMTAKQVKLICEHGLHIEEDEQEASPMMKFVQRVFKDMDKYAPSEFAQAARETHGDVHMARAYLKRLEAYARDAYQQLEEDK